MTTISFKQLQAMCCSDYLRKQNTHLWFTQHLEPADLLPVCSFSIVVQSERELCVRAESHVLAVT